VTFCAGVRGGPTFGFVTFLFTDIEGFDSSVGSRCGSLYAKGETMTTAEIAAYAYDQIDQARAELDGVSK
jgi:hypothetical protein